MSSIAGTRFADLGLSLAVLAAQLDRVEACGESLSACFRRGGKVLACGNGGSAALAAHFTAELVGRYHGERRALPAVWIGADQATLTALVNDYGVDEVFARQIDAFASPGDIVVLLSTSGASSNLLAATRRAVDAGAHCIALTGPRPNPLADLAHTTIAVPGTTAIVQEVHQVAVHLLCEVIEACLDEPLLAGIDRDHIATVSDAPMPVVTGRLVEGFVTPGVPEDLPA